ncbi:MAG: dipicolinate synthase subunit B [Lachnobacterium sp.]|nr:dipicolinate synthase subunit B [Lachnobacterium sp.]MDD6633447.1 dipicolinate synthase subunit B [Lachnobacterium sp.]MDY2911257.1 dipicolinate synthase subunit B [Agathobacter sp.]
MDLSSYTIGYGITGSFCTFEKTKIAVGELVKLGAAVVPIFSYNVQSMDTRFGGAKEFMEAVEEITGNHGIKTIQEAEPIGPKANLDVMVIAPCTGNTMAKLWNGITDSPVLMASKAHLRNQKPLVISISTNDAMGMNFKNIGNLMNTKNIYFVPFGQDDYKKKPASLIGDLKLLPDTIDLAMEGRQIQPVVV